MNDALVKVLQSGGDHRLDVDAEGLSPYRATTTPSTQLPFASCTASSMGVRGWAAAEAAFDVWDADGREATALVDLLTSVRRQLLDIFELGPEHTDLARSTALLPSGTDALYLVSCMALARTARVHHVVVGASELGSGTRAACEGQSFSAKRPLGEGPKGEDLPDLAERCSTDAVYLRDSAGHRRSIDSIDSEVAARVEAALDGDTTVVVHLVDHSKTGLRAPSLELGDVLTARYGEQVMILVDAAQGRLAPADIRCALESGFVVMFTGSKFYSGPPFSCALFVPEPWDVDPGPLPAVLSHWFTAADMPPTWTTAAASLARPVNAGLVFRWMAAMAELSAYHAIPPQRRAAVYSTFAGAVHEVIGTAAAVELEFPVPPVHGLASRLAALPTVFGFRVHREGRWLDKAALKELHARLDTPLHTYDPALQARYHIGQPVGLGPPDGEGVALLRLALGARLVTDLADRPDAGGAWFRQQLQGLVAKLTVLLEEAS